MTPAEWIAEHWVFLALGVLILLGVAFLDVYRRPPRG